MCPTASGKKKERLQDRTASARYVFVDVNKEGFLLFMNDQTHQIVKVDRALQLTNFIM